jgi:hypothetical protein
MRLGASARRDSHAPTGNEKCSFYKIQGVVENSLDESRGIRETVVRRRRQPLSTAK